MIKKRILKTGEVSKLFDVNRSTLNYYVREGLLRPNSSDNQYNLYWSALKNRDSK